MVKTNNKIVLRLPPYHCELNAIELAWAIVKKHVKDNNKTFKLQDIKHLLIEGVNKVSPDMWKNFVVHVIKEEEKAWSLDNVVEDHMSAENQPCVLTIG
ncbi:DDE 3 domain-containing protein [Aphis craccivora]|uniref:DDE 3 domain-containing protein n=1 Tax=Aphis craccivora TaxID=307492 RepID=A0A6G0WSL5_APHCR|nr:DDE 3 domain-containing protein [Aphis craccivora]